MTLHPDAAPVHARLWSVDSPTEHRDGSVTLTVRGKTTSQEPDTDAEEADRIARALIPDAELTHTFRTLFNREPIRTYIGTSMSELAVRRG